MYHSKYFISSRLLRQLNESSASQSVRQPSVRQFCRSPIKEAGGKAKGQRTSKAHGIRHKKVGNDMFYTINGYKAESMFTRVKIWTNILFYSGLTNSRRTAGR